MRRSFLLLVVFLLSLSSLSAQTLAVDDPVLKNIWFDAMDSTQLPRLAHELLEVIGPRVVGTPQMMQANDWVVSTYKAWNVEARNEQYGQWRGWERGVTHIDLLEPRVRTLEGTMLAWSPGTKKNGVKAECIILPDVTFDSLKAKRERETKAWGERIRKTGFRSDTLANVLEQAGAVGVISSMWSQGWGARRIFGTKAQTAPVVDLSLEDYGMVYRLIESGNKPVVRIFAESKFLAPQPAFNTIGMIRGTEKPEEYVIFSAHLDSWDGATGATDNGTGTIIMMEAMRILKKYYPNPKRTILAGHWGSEEQGLNGSRAFVADHPEIVAKAQAVFNQDNGTGRVVNMSAQGFVNAGEFLARWLTRVPSEVTRHIQLGLPGMPGGGGSDNASFTTVGAPGFGLGSNSWDYFAYTWHTNRDTYDKLVFDEIKNNVVLAASLAYLASEDPQFVPREKRVMPIDPKTGQPRPWPQMRGEPDRVGGGR
ncbi:MAG: M20/M25/M40 family metallo-hydrolase [Bacteroidetes bacterium]|nr:M20/M25/M40 family metallo-hydrolase [Bacteroidota bacterium]